MSLCLNPDCLTFNLNENEFCQKCRSKLFLQDRYQAVKLIGRGRFGKTFKAVDNGKPSKPYCVIKQFFPSAQGKDTTQKVAELFERAAIRLEKLGRHPHIPELFAYLTHDDQRQYLVQEYIKGQNLEQELKEQGAFNEAKIRALLIEVLPILEFIHDKGVIHRDIKPENIIRRASDKQAFLVDFSAAKVITVLDRSIIGTFISSTEYVAPEQANGKTVNASDLYSLGVTCIHLLTQVSPLDLFDTHSHEWIWRQFLVNNKVSDDLGRVLDKMIEFGTRNRYHSASEILQDLQRKSPTIQPSCQTAATPTILTPRQPKVSSNVVLKSTKRINCSKLQKLLEQEKWKEADQETYTCMITAVGRKEGDYFWKEDIQNFLCEDLRIIDELWVKHSNGRFGFSVQKDIWLEMGGEAELDTECKLAERVGWRKGGEWMSYDSLKFDLSAPPGHLPCRARWALGGGSCVVCYGGAFFSRAKTCNL